MVIKAFEVVAALVVFAASARAQVPLNVLKDASGNVVAMSSETLTPGDGTVLITGVTDLPAAAREPGALFDAGGRCLWKLVGKDFVKASAPDWPQDFERKKVAMDRHYVARAALQSQILGLERERDEAPDDADAITILIEETRAKLAALRVKK